MINSLHSYFVESAKYIEHQQLQFYFLEDPIQLTSMYRGKKSVSEKEIKRITHFIIK
jgi:hypothetical protein